MATERHPLDPEVRQHVTELLYELLPALYRVQDEPPKGQGDLRRFLSILAAPLAEVRQSVESLHADLFIDSADDPMLSVLAEMVGTTLVFPEAASNRRDVRGTATWRRRKGTPHTLSALAAELLGQLVVTQEGWKRLLVTQDVNVPRPERIVPSVRELLLAEAASGPRDRLFHALDPREISARTGRYHPRQLTHWLHSTQLFSVREAPARQRLDLSAYTFHPLGVQQTLRLGGEDSARAPEPTDRLPTQHFAREPGRYFGEGRAFSVRICGLPAAVVEEEAPSRQPSALGADTALVEGPVRLALLEQGSRGWTGPVRVDVLAVPLEASATVGAWVPRLGAGSLRGGVTLQRSGAEEASSAFTALAGRQVAMLRLRPLPAGSSAWFPGATLEVVSESPRARLASGVPALAAEGFLRGALLVQLPACWLDGDRWLHLAADGTVREAVSPTGQPLAVRERGAFHLLEGEVLASGPGAAWPPVAPRASDERLSQILASPARGPVVMHGGPVLRSSGERVPFTMPVALAFAARYRTRSGLRYQPILRLDWLGEIPWGRSQWTPLDSQGRPVLPSARFAQLAQLQAQSPDELQLVVRLEGGMPGLVLPPCEVVWTLASGEPVLLHLPTLSTLRAAKPEARWKTVYPAVGPLVGLAADGSSVWPRSGRIARYSLGGAPAAPIREHATLRRRRLRGSRLDSPGRVGHLDVDTTWGLFAFSVGEQPQAYPFAMFLSKYYHPPPAAVTVGFQEGFSGHVGARSAPREPILEARLPAPTRIVSVRGRHRESVPAGVPLYLKLSDALKAIQQDKSPAAHEVIQFEDSDTYELFEILEWPGNLRRLTIQAAEGERPVIRFQEARPPAAGFLYEQLTLRGLWLGGQSIVFPPAKAVEVQFCTVSGAGDLWIFQPPGKDAAVNVFRSVTAGLELRGPGVLSVRDSVVDAGAGQALLTQEATCELSRVTVLGETRVHSLEASEALFDGPVRVVDRFHGCVRYSRVPEDAVLPRRHRVVVGGEVRFVSRDRSDPAHARLASDCAPAIVRGAEDGSEMGAFHHVRLAQRTEALARRLTEYTPAGLAAGILRLD